MAAACRGEPALRAISNTRCHDTNPNDKIALSSLSSASNDGVGKLKRKRALTQLGNSQDYSKCS